MRGFAVKLYTQEGNWDIVGNNIPVFFIQDPIKFPDLIHAVKAEPDRGFPQAQSAHDNFWDFASLMPESTHMLMWVMSDRAIPRSFRFMEGFGVHTFRFVNARGRSTFVKFHWKPKQGMQSVLWDEAVKINGADPDFHRRDLWDAIEQGDFPEWELGIQAFDDRFADRFDFDVLDATKLIPEEVAPGAADRPAGARPHRRQLLRRDRAGRVLHRRTSCPASTSPTTRCCRAATSPTSTPRSSGSAGPNFTHIPVNAPKCPMAHFQQDGHMAMANPVGRTNYEPNSRTGDERGPREDPGGGFQTFPEAMDGPKRRLRAESFADHYSQAGQFFRSQTAVEQQHIVDAFTFELSKVEDAGDPRADGGQPPQRRRRTSPPASPPGSGMPALPKASPVGRRTRPRPSTRRRRSASWPTPPGLVRRSQARHPRERRRTGRRRSRR